MANLLDSLEEWLEADEANTVWDNLTCSSQFIECGMPWGEIARVYHHKTLQVHPDKGGSHNGMHPATSTVQRT